MAKNVIKELIIILLLCLAIILLLGILMYEYVPISKTIPNPVSYSAPEEVQKELSDTSEDVLLSFNNNGSNEEIDSSDLNNYEKINNYQPGKANPFSSYTSSTSGENTTLGGSSNGVGGAENNNSTSTGTATNNDTNTTNSSGGQFFQDKGTK